MNTTKSIFYGLSILSFTFFQSCVDKIQHENKFVQWERPQIQQNGMVWPNGQIVPQFAELADTLDAMYIDRPPLTSGDVLMLTTLQGAVNRIKPRIMLFSEKRGGREEWADKLGMNTRMLPIEERWNLIKKYSSDINGAVLYNVAKSVHYQNLASTVASINGCIAVTSTEYKALHEAGVVLPIVEDLTGLTLTEPAEIYSYLYTHYWDKCTRRILLSLSPNVVNDIRDMAVAVNAASVWLDPRKEDEKKVLEMFFSDMVAGESIVLGWWPEERSGIGIGTSFGISTIPSDFYDNSTVFAAGSHTIFHSPVPRRKALENKVYISIFLSDGDNVQYCQHTMQKLWNNEKRGIIPINWTASPGLADLGPGILNYYYRTATENDCLSSGPSGLGYALIYDAHNKVWFASGREKIDPYTRFTQQYLEKSGMRSITIWDEIDDEQAQSYADNCRYLYGLTQQDWRRGEKVKTVIKNGRLAVLPNIPCYENNIDAIHNYYRDTISSFNGSNPVFLAAQGISWKLGPQDLVLLQEKLDKLAPGKVAICRADHFFSLYNEANGLDFNIAMSQEVEKTSGENGTEIKFDFKKEYEIDRYVVRHAGYKGEDSKLNTKAFSLYASVDGQNWVLVDRQKGNRSDVSDIDFPTIVARYAKIIIDNSGKDGIVRINDIEIYGKTLKTN